MGNSQGHRRWFLGSKPPEADTVFCPQFTALSAKCYPTITQMWKLRTGESNNLHMADQLVRGSWGP